MLRAAVALTAAWAVAAELPAWPHYPYRNVTVLDGEWQFGLYFNVHDATAVDPHTATPNSTIVPSAFDVAPPGYMGVSERGYEVILPVFNWQAWRLWRAAARDCVLQTQRHRHTEHAVAVQLWRVRLLLQPLRRWTTPGRPQGGWLLALLAHRRAQRSVGSRRPGSRRQQARALVSRLQRAFCLCSRWLVARACTSFAGDSRSVARRPACACSSFDEPFN
jgi:hypothetical protein